MRPIKFDLPLNGTRIATLDQLEKNLTPEIFEAFRSGKLAKWLRVRLLNEQAEAVEMLLAGDNEREVQLFKNLCELFVSQVDENDAREAINEYKTLLPISRNVVDETIIYYSRNDDIYLRMIKLFAKINNEDEFNENNSEKIFEHIRQELIELTNPMNEKNLIFRVIEFFLDQEESENKEEIKEKASEIKIKLDLRIKELEKLNDEDLLKVIQEIIERYKMT